MTGVGQGPDSDIVAALMTDDHAPGEERLLLGLDGDRLALRSNSSELIEELADYFGDHVIDGDDADVEVVAIERPPLDVEEALAMHFVDWAREQGKTGRKDADVDLADGRLVHKVRTGLTFLQRAGDVIAAGPCREHPDQVVNFVNAQYMNRVLQHGRLICHAAALAADDRAIGVAGFSGAGKSTLLLHLMEQPGVAYVTNDRLFVRRDGERVRARGIPKLPRVNPGTIIGNPRLHRLISPAEHDRFAAMPRDQLWELEQKHDVHVHRVYGPGGTAREASLAAFVVLGSRRDGDCEATMEQVDLAERPELLGTIMKSPGPFHHDADGHFHADDVPHDAAAYLQALHGVPVFEVTGRVDLPGISERIAALSKPTACIGALHDT